MRRLVLLLSILTVFGARALACSCAVRSTVDKEFEEAANVVILKARSVKKSAEASPYSLFAGGIERTTLTVEKVYKGTLKVGQELVFAQGGGADCVWTFSEESIGEEFLFYLDAKPYDHRLSIIDRLPKEIAKDFLRDDSNEVWAGSTCSRSNHVRLAAADLLYLNNIKAAKGRTRLSGSITQYVESAIEEQPSFTERRAGHRIVITGNGKSITLKTDNDGVYEIYDLPPGKYTVCPDAIEGYVNPCGGRSEDRQEIIKPKSHTERNFYLQIDSAIRGKLFDLTGKPMKDVCLDLIPSRGTPRRYYYGGDCTEADGTFEFTQVPAGSYIILFNDKDRVTARQPFRSFYYPRAEKRKDAGEIQIAPGTKVENLIVIPPAAAEVITISGSLRVEDGKLPNADIAEYAHVEFIADGDDKATEHDPSSRADIDQRGRFTIRILKGQTGRLYGTMSAYKGKFVNCPKIEKLVGNRTNIVDLETPHVLINADRDQIGIELTFPFPNCKAAK